MDAEKSGWHLDKRVPIALIAALLLQTAGFVWWVATFTANLTQRVSVEQKGD